MRFFRTVWFPLGRAFCDEGRAAFIDVLEVSKPDPGESSRSILTEDEDLEEEVKPEEFKPEEEAGGEDDDGEDEEEDWTEEH